MFVLFGNISRFAFAKKTGKRFFERKKSFPIFSDLGGKLIYTFGGHSAQNISLSSSAG